MYKVIQGVIMTKGAYLKATIGISSVYISDLLSPLLVGDGVHDSSVGAVSACGHVHWCCATESAHAKGGLIDAVES